MRWIAYFFLQDNGESNQSQQRNTYGFKTKRSAPNVTELKPFEDDISTLLESVKFRSVSDEFIESIEKDMETIKASNNVFIFAEMFTKWTRPHTTNC